MSIDLKDKLSARPNSLSPDAMNRVFNIADAIKIGGLLTEVPPEEQPQAKDAAVQPKDAHANEAEKEAALKVDMPQREPKPIKKAHTETERQAEAAAKDDMLRAEVWSKLMKLGSGHRLADEWGGYAMAMGGARLEKASAILDRILSGAVQMPPTHVAQRQHLPHKSHKDTGPAVG